MDKLLCSVPNCAATAEVVFAGYSLCDDCYESAIDEHDEQQTERPEWHKRLEREIALADAD